VGFEWRWSWELCVNCRFNRGEAVYTSLEHETRTKTCPKCGFVDKQFSHPEVWKRMMLVRDLLYSYPPAQYLFRNMKRPEEIADTFLRTYSKLEWGERVMHDYIVAKLRHDEERQQICREALYEVARRMDYGEEWAEKIIDHADDVTKSADFAALKIYEIAKEKLRVEGWRKNKDETLYEAPRKRTLSKDEKFKRSEEWLRWDEYERGLQGIYYYYWWRKDMAGCWITREVLRRVHVELYGDDDLSYFDFDPLLDDEEAMIEGREDPRDIIDIFVEECFRDAEFMYRKNKQFYVDGIARSAILALAAKLGYDVKKLLLTPDVPQKIVEEIALKTQDPEILELFNDTKYTFEGGREDPEAAWKLVEKVRTLIDLMSRQEEEKRVYVS